MGAGASTSEPATDFVSFQPDATPVNEVEFTKFEEKNQASGEEEEEEAGVDLDDCDDSELFGAPSPYNSPQRVKISDAENLKIRETFESFDLDKNGTISAEEFKQCLGALGGFFGFQSNDVDVHTLLSLMDTNGDGVVCWNEFHTCVSQWLTNQPAYCLLTSAQRASLRQTFDAYDVNKNNTIEKHELHLMLEGVGHLFGHTVHDLEKLMALLDVNRTGSITWTQFLTRVAVWLLPHTQVSAQTVQRLMGDREWWTLVQESTQMWLAQQSPILPTSNDDAVLDQEEDRAQQQQSTAPPQKPQAQ